MKPEHYAKVFKAAGEIVDVRPEDGRYFSLKELQGFVGGSIEMVRAPAGRVMTVNETGRLDGAAVNENATRLFVPAGSIGSVIWPIVGDVLVCDDCYLE
jgi:hypothetical protein